MNDRKIRVELVEELAKLLGGELPPESTVTNPTVLNEYNERLYDLLGSKYPRPEKVDGNVTAKLFQLGFPLPIYDLELFVRELENNLTKAMGFAQDLTERKK